MDFYYLNFLRAAIGYKNAQIVTKSKNGAQQQPSGKFFA
jgi:hypothetical protein